MEYQPRIMIAGETAGTGASTTAKILSEQLGISTVSGGRYLRALANRFASFRREHHALSLEESYGQFLSVYQNIFDTQGIHGIQALIAEGITQGANGELVAAFHAAIEQNAERNNHRTDPLWDHIVDENTTAAALRQPGFIWESKLAIIALELDQMQHLVRQDSYPNMPNVKVLLKLDPKIAAQRVGDRENRKVNVDEIFVRKQRDFERYGALYTIHGERVKHQNLSQTADVAIDTKNIPATEVAVKILAVYVQKIASLGQEKQSLALPAIQRITALLPQIK